MKKLAAILCTFSLVLLASSPLMAGGITNKQNLSIEYLGTFSRNAATDSADAAVFNPAGVTEMEDGIYIDTGAFYALKDYSNTIAGQEYSSDEPSIVPTLITLYKKDNWAAFGAFTIPAGGGKVSYEKGDATTMGYGKLLMAGINYKLTLPPPIGMGLPAGNYYNSISKQALEAESTYYGYTLGGAYKFNDIVSFSLGARFINAEKAAVVSIAVAGAGMPTQTFNIDYEEKASGWGGFIGLNFTPRESFNIGLRYETKTKLDFETGVNRDDTKMLVNGSKEKEDLPGLFGIGIGYRINPDIRIDTSYTYYLEKNADRADPRFKDVGNSYDLAISIMYTFNPRLKGSLGYMITNINMKPENMLPEAAELDANTVCAGLYYELKSNLDLNFGIQRSIYKSAKRSDGIELGKDVISLGLGVQYKFK